MKKKQWNYWRDRVYYQEELKKRALGEKEEMESAKFITSLVVKESNDCDSILDVGCGTGHFILSLEKKIKKTFLYHGIDITEQHIIDANSIFGNIKEYTFQIGDIRNLPIKDKSFNVSICSNTIPHIPNIDKAIQELIRTTKNDIFIRMLIGNETLISKKALTDEMDENGEPISYMYVNIYKEDYIKKIIGDSFKVKIYDDVFDEERIKTHYKKHSEIAGNNIATNIINNKQFKGYLMLPWKVVHIKLR